MTEGPELTQHENHIEVDYLDLEDLIEQEIQEMTIGAPTNGVADIIFQTHLVVKLDSTVFHDKTAKEIADLIVAEIEGGDDYSWNFHNAEMSKKFGNTVGRFYYFCCQSKEAQSENYKDSNRKRRTCYNCKGRITIQVDLVLNAVEVDIYHHSLHPHPDLCIEMPNELQEKIKKHSHLTAIELKNHLRRQGFDISKYSPKRIYYWKSIANQELFQRHDNHIESACKLLSEHESCGFQWCLEINDSDTIAIGFITPLLKEIKNCNISISEIYLDVTYKTARGCYELYGVIADVEGTGFPIAYLILDTTKVIDTNTGTEKRRKVLECFLESVKSHDINLDFVFTDKDFAEINAATKVWGPSIVQLCAWHINRAVKLKLREKAKQSNNEKHGAHLHIAYNVIQAMNEFDFIDLAFYPTKDDCDLKKYIICPLEYQTTVLMIMNKHFNMHSLIPVDAQGTTLILTDIRRNAIREIYQFCTENSLKLLWAYLWSNCCSAFLGSRFLLCKHLVQQVTIMPNGDKVTASFLPIMPLEIEINTNNMSNNSIDIEKDPKEEARSYVESNWALFEQAINQINSEKSANNWRHVRTITEWSRLVQMEKDMQATEKQKHRRPTWASTKLYLMYLSYPEELHSSKDKKNSSESALTNNTNTIITENIKHNEIYQN
ncbi:ATP-dependent DNA helicase pif1 [Gigaspora margarita]|uniref:ATP-dependent DNA helicase pif1 n=1 Tax=Gigaspora margarita TaxID=4874 RepID=A0A8H4ABI1_GIGMA|nr:ATP-dependent DNA helicase pif1 [Gigaspora margarita]